MGITERNYRMLPTLVITPLRYRVLAQEAARQIARTYGDNDKTTEAAVNAASTVLSLLGVVMVPDGFPLETPPDAEHPLANAEAYREWLAGLDGHEDEKRALGIPVE